MPAPSWVEAIPEGMETPKKPTGLQWWDTRFLIAELETRGYLVVRKDHLIPLGTPNATLTGRCIPVDSGVNQFLCSDVYPDWGDDLLP